MEKLSRQVYEYFFCDENGYQYSGHPDRLAVSREKVVKKFPKTVEWPVVKVNRYGNGYVLKDGIYLFPDFDHSEPAFEWLSTEGEGE